ncbi:MAG: LysR family transcriptional regulator [Sediminimonas qiaohouensis]|uniref:LysR family transcriptional regulator n=1 Tax=Sediminimonas qiaohouensis TaxID=552061 RepID=A0A7C9LK95_9RHOB|nr:LysR family transcriptional regulator [Sediminimonas qiaohouensis]MTJ03819.1 LysR family transcriptional regulator [Sediminimonas qiaohouensis]
MDGSQTRAILFEMLRSFTTLARTLNLSRAVRELGSTRQTVRRHIAQLEEARGEQLFVLEDRQYRLTKAGREALLDALDILAHGEAWLENQSRRINGLTHIAMEGEGGWGFFLQQHPISKVWTQRAPMLRDGLRAWAMAEGELEHAELEGLRPYLMVFRKLDEEWVCVEVGQRSSYATWYGWKWERSAIGRALPSLPGGSVLARLLARHFEEMAAGHGLRYDHIHTQMARGEEGDFEPVNYRRLLMGCRFPDESFALVSLVERTYDIEIEGLPEERRLSMPAGLAMDDSEVFIK